MTTLHVVYGRSGQMSLILQHKLSNTRQKVIVLSLTGDKTGLSTELLEHYEQIFVYWTIGFTRPENKHTLLSEWFAGNFEFLLQELDKFKSVGERVSFNYMSSHLVLDEIASNRELPYCKAKTISSWLVTEAIPTTNIHFIPNNESLMRNYNHWLQTVLFNIYQITKKKLPTDRIGINPKRNIKLCSTYTLVDNILATKVKWGEQVQTRYEVDCVNINELVNEAMLKYDFTLDDALFYFTPYRDEQSSDEIRSGPDLRSEYIKCKIEKFSLTKLFKDYDKFQK